MSRRRHGRRTRHKPSRVISCGRGFMTNWEERINRGGDPLIVIEHVVRYGFAPGRCSPAPTCGSTPPAAPATHRAWSSRSSRSRRGRCCSRTPTSRRSPPPRGRCATSSCARWWPTSARTTASRRWRAPSGRRTAAVSRSRRWRPSSTSRTRCGSSAGSVTRPRAATPTSSSACRTTRSGRWTIRSTSRRGARAPSRSCGDCCPTIMSPRRSSPSTARASRSSVAAPKRSTCARTCPPRASQSLPRRVRAALRGSADRRRRHGQRPPRPASVGAAARGRSRVPLRGSARARERDRLRRVKVCFVLNDIALSGGIGVVVEHAHQLVERHGFDVTVATTKPDLEPWTHRRLAAPHVRDRG